MENRKANIKRNVLFTLAIVAVVVLLLAVQRFLYPPQADAVPYACLQYGDPVKQIDIPLDQNKTYDIDTGYYTIHLEVRDGSVAFVNSPCPDHLCEGFGWLDEPGDWAACLPATAILTIEIPREDTP